MNNKYLRFSILTFLGTWFVYKLYKSADETFIFDVFTFFFIGGLGFSFHIWTTFKDNEEYAISQDVTSYLPTFTGIIFIGIIVSMTYFQDKKMNEPSLLTAFYDGGYNGFSIDLKKNGNYIMENGSGLGGSNFYGTYTISDSIVTLDKSNIDNIITTNKLVIRNTPYFLPLDSTNMIDKTKANYITQIDKNGIEFDTEFRFRVTQDNRTKH
jgi:hypothetical protein